MNKYEELAAKLIDIVSDEVENQHPEIILKTDISEECNIEDPALICGDDYYSLESEIARILENFVDKCKRNRRKK